MIGVDLCACQPGSWEFTIDFSLTCANQTLFEQRPGIVIAQCQEDIPGTTFAQIDEASVIEADGDFNAIRTQNFGALNNGDTISYVSALDNFTSFNATTLPQLIIVSFSGQNTQGLGLNVFWLLVFSNDCQVFIDNDDAFPVIVPGDQSATTHVVRNSRRFYRDSNRSLTSLFLTNTI